MATKGLDIQQTPFPAKSKTASGVLGGKSTTVSTITFTDRILITITQSGQLSHWVHVPLSTAAGDPMNPGTFSIPGTDGENSLLPRSVLTATTVLGGTKREDEIVGQTLATTIASAILMKRPSEERLLVMGLGLYNATDLGRSEFDQVLDLVLQCI